MEPRTELGKKLMALREKAMANGMTTISAGEILGLEFYSAMEIEALRSLVREMGEFLNKTTPYLTHNPPLFHNVSNFMDKIEVKAIMEEKS